MEPGNTAFKVQLEDGRSVHCHVDHILSIKTNVSLSESGKLPTAEQLPSSATVEPFPLVDNGSVKESSSVKLEEPAIHTTDTTVPLQPSIRI